MLNSKSVGMKNSNMSLEELMEESVLEDFQNNSGQSGK